ncbi:MAG: hypothetical protein V7694_03440 [Rhodococcus sp. (in: high G+C Gram-positive bacteria)]
MEAMGLTDEKFLGTATAMSPDFRRLMKPTHTNGSDAMEIYYWCTGQDDNIGDVVLRRRLLEVLHDASPDSGKSVHIYVGAASSSFVEGLEVPAKAKIYTAKIRWYLALVKQIFTPRPPVLVLNPGEVQRNAHTILAYTLLMLPSMAIRLRGGAIVRTGIAIDHRGAGLTAKIAKLVVRLNSVLASEATFRDIASHREFGHGRIVPDWAIHEPSNSKVGTERDVIAVTFRSDRPEAYDDKTIDQIQRLATKLQANVTVFCQVRRDSTAMKQLSLAAGWSFIDWPLSLSHNDQEKIVRDLFSKSVVVCSNRIHALIIGLTEGAQAICISSESEPKVRTHLEYFGLATVLDANGSIAGNVGSGASEFRAQSGALAKASADVANLASQVKKIVGASS